MYNETMPILTNNLTLNSVNYRYDLYRCKSCRDDSFYESYSIGIIEANKSNLNTCLLHDVVPTYTQAIVLMASLKANAVSPQNAAEVIDQLI